MAWLIPFLLLAWPFAEIALFVSVADWIGWLPAIGLILLSGVLGAALLGGRNPRDMLGLRQKDGRDATLAAGLFDEASRALAGLLLLIPGFLTDGLALCLLLPPVRTGLARALLAGLVRSAGGGPAPSGRPSGASPGTTVIDADFKVVDTPSGDAPARQGGDEPRLPGPPSA